MNNIEHYVGLTGAQSSAQAKEALSIFYANGFAPRNKHTNMIGGLVSPATIENGEPQFTDTPFRHVSDFRTLVDLLLEIKGKGIGMIHFETAKDWGNGAKGETSIIRLWQALDREGIQPAIQVNGVLSATGLNELHTETSAPIVLQLRRQISDRPRDDVFRYIDIAQGSIAKILMDPSAGAGDQIDVASTVALQGQIEKRFPAAFTYGFAGGLHGGNTAGTITALKQAKGSDNFSIDIETGARTKTGGQHRLGKEIDVLDMQKLESYVRAAAMILRNN